MSLVSRSPVLIISGPTACGKSALGLAIAELFNGVIINADSMQIYRDLPLITAQPTPTDMQRVPHLLYGILNGEESFSVVHWLSLVDIAITNTHTSGRLPIVIGGTGLYIKALQHHLLDLIPEVPEIIRYRTRILMTEIGERAFRSLLAIRDPIMAKKLSDPHRLQRAWEILESTGRSLADWQKEKQDLGKRKEQIYLCITLMPPRLQLYAACNRRFSQSVVDSVLSEVTCLLSRFVPSDYPVLKALGVPVFTRYLHGNITLTEAITTVQMETCHYAKRQCTWFRSLLTRETLLLQVQYKAGYEIPDEVWSTLSKFLN